MQTAGKSLVFLENGAVSRWSHVRGVLCPIYGIKGSSLDNPNAPEGLDSQTKLL